MLTWFRGSGSVASCHLRQRGFGLGQPEGHVHGAVELDGGGQGGAGLLPLASLVVQPAQPVVAVGHEWAHAKLLGQGQGLLIVGFGLRDLDALHLACAERGGVEVLVTTDDAFIAAAGRLTPASVTRVVNPVAYALEVLQ